MASVTDFLGNSGILRNARLPREEFNPNNRDHLQSLRSFLDTGNWGAVQFYCEAPCLNVPETVLRKIADASLAKLGI